MSFLVEKKVIAQYVCDLEELLGFYKVEKYF